MEFKGTKGEWDIYVDDNCFCIKNEKSESICIINSKIVDNEESANAKLISYAPELLELLNHFVDISDELNVPDHLIETFANLYANAFNTVQKATTI